MRQEVNLYLPEFRRGKQWLSAQSMLILFCAFFLLLCLLQMGLWWHFEGEKEERVRVEAQRQEIEQRLIGLRARKPQAQKSHLAGQINQLQQQLQRSRQISGIIGGHLGNSRGFSSYLQAMARQVPDSIALTEFRFLSAGEYVELAGWTRRPNAVPLFLQQLRRENSFEKVKFGVMSIARNRDEKDRLFFSLGQAPTEKVSLLKKTEIEGAAFR